MKETLLKGVASGVVAGVATKLLFGDAGNVELFNMPLDPAIVNGVAVGAGSIASDVFSERIIENMNLPQNVISLEEKLIRFGVCGATSAAVLMVASDLPSANAGKAILLGGLSKYGGDYAYDQLLSPQHGIMPIF